MILSNLLTKEYGAGVSVSADTVLYSNHHSLVEAQTASDGEAKPHSGPEPMQVIAQPTDNKLQVHVSQACCILACLLVGHARGAEVDICGQSMACDDWLDLRLPISLVVLRQQPQHRAALLISHYAVQTRQKGILLRIFRNAFVITFTTRVTLPSATWFAG